MRLESVTLSGFRSYGPEPITVPISPEITVVVGPNWLDLEADVRPLLGPESADAFNVGHVSGPVTQPGDLPPR